MQGGLSHERPSVSPSVCPSGKRVHCDETKETCAYILIPNERSFILVLRQEERLVEDDPFYPEF